MKSYTNLRDDYGEDTKNTSNANLTYGTTRMNDFHRKLLSLADWPFLHRPRTLTTVAPESVFTAATSDICTATSTILTETGTRVRVSTTGTLPAGLSADTDYRMIYQSATTFKLANSLANALAGTAVDITNTGTGTHTVEVKERMQPLPYDVDLVESVEVEVGGSIYSPDPAPNRHFWNQLNYQDSTSDYPEFWFTHNGKIGLWPRPSTAGNLITINCRIRVPDLNVADYTTGTVDIVTNGSTKVTGSSTAWTTPMMGRWIRITHSNTAVSSGDGEWYEINAVESATVLYLARPYGGRSLTAGAGAAYTIGQMPLLPEAHHDLPELYAAWRYWAKEKDDRAVAFKNDVSEGIDTLMRAHGINDLSLILESGEATYPINPNIFVQL